MQTIILAFTNNPINATALMTAATLSVSFFAVLLPQKK
jgi:hypothetical protein